MIGLGKAPINILMNICLPRQATFSKQKTHKPIKHSPHCPQQADRPLSAYFTARTQGVLRPVSKYVCSPRWGWEHAGDNSDPCPCKLFPQLADTLQLPASNKGQHPARGPWAGEGVGGATATWLRRDGRGSSLKEARFHPPPH